MIFFSCAGHGSSDGHGYDEWHARSRHRRLSHFPIPYAAAARAIGLPALSKEDVPKYYQSSCALLSQP